MSIYILQILVFWASILQIDPQEWELEIYILGGGAKILPSHVSKKPLHKTKSELETGKLGKFS